MPKTLIHHKIENTGTLDLSWKAEIYTLIIKKTRLEGTLGDYLVQSSAQDRTITVQTIPVQAIPERDLHCPARAARCKDSWGRQNHHPPPGPSGHRGILPSMHNSWVMLLVLEAVLQSQCLRASQKQLILKISLWIYTIWSIHSPALFILQSQCVKKCKSLTGWLKGFIHSLSSVEHFSLILHEKKQLGVLYKNSIFFC